MMSEPLRISRNGLGNKLRTEHAYRRVLRRISQSEYLQGKLRVRITDAQFNFGYFGMCNFSGWPAFVQRL